MIVKNNAMEINENSIFKNDALSREDSIKDLSQIIIANNEPLVFSINASWGSGKTTFVKMWQAYLKKECAVNSLYFSAWEDDFSKEPLISILGELNTYISENFPANSPQRSGFKKVINISGKVLKIALPAAMKGATAGLLDFDAGFEGAASSIAENSTKVLIENYSVDKNILKEFKKSIENVLTEIDKNKPFIIFIDELDRCRPLYSIELLERIKHIFGIEKLVFVLSIDKSQLSESIKSQYGNIDANNYLKRFIDLEYNLSNVNLDSFCDKLYMKFNLENILKTKGINKEVNIEFHHLTILKKLAHLFELSLRDIEQIFTKLHLLFSTITPRLFDSHFRVFVFFEMLKSYDSSLYYDFINRKISSDKIKDLVLPKFKDESVYKDVSIIFENILDSTGKTDEEYNKLIEEKSEKLSTMSDYGTKYKSEYEASDEEKRTELDLIIKNNHLEHKRLKHSIRILSTGFDQSDNYMLNNLVNTVIKKIEFTDKFNFETI